MPYCDDGYAPDRLVEKCRSWRHTDQLTPRPPNGWLVALSLPPEPRAAAVGMWIGFLTLAQRDWPKQVEGRSHMICRDRWNERVVLIHPAVRKLANHVLDEFNCHVDCCSGDHIEGELQAQAVKVFARRTWPKLSLFERIDAANDEGFDLRNAVDPDYDRHANSMMCAAYQLGYWTDNY